MQNTLTDINTTQCPNQFPTCFEGDTSIMPSKQTLLPKTILSNQVVPSAAEIEDWNIAGVLDAFKITFHNGAIMMIDNKELLVCESEKTLHAVLTDGSIPDGKAYRCALPCHFSAFRKCATNAYPTVREIAEKRKLPHTI